MKTAMTELISELVPLILADDIQPLLFNFRKLCNKAIIKEKEQIIAAGNFLPHDEQNEIKTPEEYYKQTYNN